MNDSVDNNLKQQKDDSLKFLREVAKENSANISDDLLENIYNAVMKATPDGKVNLNKELEKLITDEVEGNEDK